MKTKDETLDMAKRWFAEIADVRINCPLIVVVRDNSGENTSKDLNDFFTTLAGTISALREQVRFMISNQVRFDENLYPYLNSEMVSQHLNDITVVDVMSLDTGN